MSAGKPLSELEAEGDDRGANPKLDCCCCVLLAPDDVAVAGTTGSPSLVFSAMLIEIGATRIGGAREYLRFLAGDSNFSTVCNLWFGREPSSLPRWFFGSTQTGRGNGPAAAALHSRLTKRALSVRPSQRQRCRRRHRRRQRRPRRHGRGAGGGRRWAGGARKILPPPPPRCCMAGGRFRWFPCPQPS